MQRKGQAAMEFLMTYGWAILAAIIAIGALAYFGVFNPAKLTSGQTVVAAPFYAVGSTVNTTDAVLEIRNDAGSTVTISSVSIKDTPSGTNCTDYTTSTNMGLSAQNTFDLSCTGQNSGDQFRGDVEINYKKSGSDLALQSTGSIVGTVQS